jgi:hypothetical protein
VLFCISVPGIIEAAFTGIRNAIEAAWNWVGNLIGRIGNISVPGIIENAIQGIRGALEAAWNWVGSLITRLGNISVPGTSKSAIDGISGAIDWLIGKVRDLISALGSIHVPKIDLPGPFSLPSPAAAVPGVTGFAAPGVPSTRATSSSTSGGVSIVVNGALDPEATARQIRRILDGHNRRMGFSS